MSAENVSKINHLLSTVPLGSVILSSWLTEQGYSLSLQARYRNSRWLKSVGSGAMIRAGDEVGYEGAVYALQKQAGLTIHPGGKTALVLSGKAHYLELSANKAILFGDKKEKLPLWMKKKGWGIALNYYPTSFLPPDMGLVEVELKTFSIKVSNPIRAMLECLYLAPQNQELTEACELMEGLNNIRPQQVQLLLEECRSIKVKRLFLYMAEKAGHAWFKHIDQSRIDLGSGKRSIVRNGVYVPKYQITVPKEIEQK